MESHNLRTLKSDTFTKFTILAFSMTLRVRRLVRVMTQHQAKTFLKNYIYINAMVQTLAFIVETLPNFYLNQLLRVGAKQPRALCSRVADSRDSLFALNWLRRLGQASHAWADNRASLFALNWLRRWDETSHVSF